MTPVMPLSGLVFAPARPRLAEGGKDAVFELRTAADGGLVLPVYSSVSGLVEALGRYQPWVHMPLVQVVAALDGQARVVVDPPVGPGAWRWTQSVLAQAGQEWAAGMPGAARPEVARGGR